MRRVVELPTARLLEVCVHSSNCTCQEAKKESRLERCAVLVAVVFLAGYFWHFWSLSLRAEFTSDDLMNCYGAFFSPWGSLVADNLLFFRATPVYRPFPALLYKTSFALYGFDLSGLRITLAGVMAFNVVLMYLAARRLTGRREIGLFAALLGGVHRNHGFLLYNTGTLYDIFCFFFYFSALVYYFRIRQAQRALSFLQSLLVAFLLTLALDSKEMAVSFPVMILLYELWKQPPHLQCRAVGRWLLQEGRLAVVSGVIVLVFILGRVTAVTDSLVLVPAYQPHVTAANYLQQAGSYLNEILCTPKWFDGHKTAILLSCLLGAAVLFRSGALLWSWVLFMAGILPLAFIPPRPLTAALIPAFGVVIYIAILLVWVRETLVRLLGGVSVVVRRASQVVLFVLVAFATVCVHRDTKVLYQAMEREEYAVIRTARQQLLALYPSQPPGARLLFLSDPFGDNYNIVFLVCLAYRDKSLVVDQLWRLKTAPDLTTYDHVFQWQDGSWIELALNFVH